MSPLAVVIPRSVRDVQRTVEAANTFGIPILARGGASSLAGQAVAEAVVIDFTNHLNRIHEINVEERWARVEPGVLLDDLNRAARSHGLMVGPDPASSNRATLGGMVANNSTGTHSILYGNVINHIVSLDVILADGTPATLATDGADDADGEASARPGMIRAALRSLVSDGEEVIRRDTPRHWRRNSGYRLESLLEPQPNLAKLICGSEGTLAVITGIKIALVPIPKVTALGVVHFHTRSEALRSVEAILATKPSAVELFDGVSLHQFRQLEGLGKSIDFVEGEPGGLLLTE
ncbi:MAG: FAD-binding oxidoreductase, partial [Bacteroidetes bacterium]|nr:FAD-binding oxidoreductase [Bacteroidota bacterium]